MNNILSIVLLIAFGTSLTYGQAKNSAKPRISNAETELIELERQLSESLVNQNATVLDHLWSNDLVFTFPNGQMSNKAQRLAGQKPVAQSEQSSNTNDEVKIHLYGNTAVVTVLSTWKGKEGTKEYSDQYQATHVWARQHGRWQLVAAHVSQVKK